MNHLIRRWMNMISESYSSLIEEWITIPIFGVDTHVGWQLHKNELNIRNHSMQLKLGV
jgi:hypothetical protein